MFYHIFLYAEEIDWNQIDIQDSRERLPEKPLSPNAIKMFSNFVLPVDEEDYLRPGAAAQSLAYLDLDGKGINILVIIGVICFSLVQSFQAFILYIGMR